MGVTYSATGVWTFYEKGVAKGTGTNNQTFTNGNTNISNNTNWWNGDMAELIKYDSVLSAGDFDKRYQLP